MQRPAKAGDGAFVEQGTEAQFGSSGSSCRSARRPVRRTPCGTAHGIAHRQIQAAPAPPCGPRTPRATVERCTRHRQNFNAGPASCAAILAPKLQSPRTDIAPVSTNEARSAPSRPPRRGNARCTFSPGRLISIGDGTSSRHGFHGSGPRIDLARRHSRKRFPSLTNPLLKPKCASPPALRNVRRARGALRHRGGRRSTAPAGRLPVTITSGIAKTPSPRRGRRRPGHAMGHVATAEDHRRRNARRCGCAQRRSISSSRPASNRGRRQRPFAAQVRKLIQAWSPAP